MKKRDITTNAASFLLGVAIGAGGVSVSESGEIVATMREVDCGDATGTTGTTDTETGDPMPPNYCDTYPQYCNNPEPCPVVVDVTGKETSGCYPAEWACCSAEAGCWAVHFPTQCGDASLFYFDCESGEQIIDEDGKGTLVCHD